MLVTLSGMTMLEREPQVKNAAPPMLVTLSGMTMLDRELQLKKAPIPMLVTLSGMTISDRERHQVNALSHIILVPSLTE